MSTDYSASGLLKMAFHFRPARSVSDHSAPYDYLALIYFTMSFGRSLSHQLVHGPFCASVLNGWNTSRLLHGFCVAGPLKTGWIDRGPAPGEPTAAPVPQQANEGKTTLWMGELEPWIDENFVRNLWFQMGEQVNVKMIRDKFSGSNAGYCFVDFASPAAAAKALSLNGTPMPNTNRLFKLNWATGGGLADRSRDDRGPEYSIFVGDLGPEVNEYVLVSLFQSRFPSCKSAKIMTDPISGMSRGYGFVRFSDENDQQRALSEMQGVYCGNRPMRISTATPKNKGPSLGAAGAMGMPGPAGMYPPMGAPPMGFYGAPQPMNQFTDPNNTTVFVGGLSGYVTEDELRSFFQGFGEITYVKIPPGKGCGFVQFVQRHAAEMAINQMQGYPIGNSR
ncbi:Arrestin (or S-antigen), N-terminal domain family protein [Aspergillus niger]|uniref:Arrestin (Or S-antigen), N-terminal domain family protein n=1 Tax=Aspergillus niger TaxID=5061 RepID=A0A505HWC6_ASPNG|nr:Arrestin (or S-antigen), N-terminal domain family protein [Aspergillus niger]